jgi:hypothetical protein
VTDTDLATDITPLADEAAEPSSPAGYGAVRADRVEIVQGGAESVTAETVTISQGGAARVYATDLSISQGGVGLARTTKLSLSGRSGALAVVADEATLEPNSLAVVLIARTVKGTLRPIVDWRAAAAFGAGLGLALALLRRGR